MRVKEGRGGRAVEIISHLTTPCLCLFNLTENPLMKQGNILTLLFSFHNTTSSFLKLYIHSSYKPKNILTVISPAQCLEYLKSCRYSTPFYHKMMRIISSSLKSSVLTVPARARSSLSPLHLPLLSPQRCHPPSTWAEAPAQPALSKEQNI